MKGCLFLAVCSLAFGKEIAYVVNSDASSISVIDTQTNQVIKTISGLNSPDQLVITPNQGKIYVLSTGSPTGTIEVISTATNEVIATIPAANQAETGIITLDGSKLYVGNYSSNTVSVISTATDTITDTIPGVVEPLAQAISPDGQKVYFLSGDVTNNSLTVINTLTNIATEEVEYGDEVDYMALLPDGSKIYSNRSSGMGGVEVTSTSNYAVSSISTGELTYFIGSSPNGTKVYCTQPFVVPPNIVTIDTNSQMAVATTNLPSGDYFYFSVTPDGSKVYIADNAGSSILVMDAVSHMIVKTISVGTTPVQIAYTQNGQYAYLTNNGSHSVSVINTTTNEVTDTITVGTGPGFILIANLADTVSVNSKSFKNQFLTQTEIYNVVNWGAPSNASSVLFYQIYRDEAQTNLAGESSSLSFTDHLRFPGTTYFYYIVSVTPDGTKSLIGSTSVTTPSS